MYNALFEGVILEALFEQILNESENEILSLVDYADDIIDTLNNLGKVPEANQKDIDYTRTKYSVCKINDLMKKFGINGTEITISYEKIKEKHYGIGLKQKRSNHIYTADFLKQACHQLLNPVMISKYITIKNTWTKFGKFLFEFKNR